VLGEPGAGHAGGAVHGGGRDMRGRRIHQVSHGAAVAASFIDGLSVERVSAYVVHVPCPYLSHSNQGWGWRKF
jgi:hypothetical protein